MNNLWLEYVIEQFAEHRGIRACGSCHGGCQNAAICTFMCLEYTMKDIEEWLSQGDRLRTLRDHFIMQMGLE